MPRAASSVAISGESAASYWRREAIDDSKARWVHRTAHHNGVAMWKSATHLRKSRQASFDWHPTPTPSPSRTIVFSSLGCGKPVNSSGRGSYR